MLESYEIVHRLTAQRVLPHDRDRMLKDFARALGWEPSERMGPEPELERITNGHLIVEHGLVNSAVITFLVSPEKHATLAPGQKTRILELSYNNLIDWHLYVEQDRVTYAFNRTDPPGTTERLIRSDDVDALKSSMFEQITGDAPNPNFPALDDALIQNISFWKRNLAAELENKPQLSDYAALFNSLIFVRAAEDHNWRRNGSRSRALLEEWEIRDPRRAKPRLIIERALRRYIEGRLPKSLFDPDQLGVFDPLDRNLLYDLLSSFYKNRILPYSYDFAIMSKHALSRIYEKYVAELSFLDDDLQLSFFKPIPEEDLSKKLGAVYTPEFIARFFARFLREQMPHSSFRELRSMDHACGSGIFLRTLLEFQCGPTYDGISSEEIREVFTRVTGIDVDENASQATRLSLSLLHLILLGGKLPKQLDIRSADAFEYFEKHPELKESYDVVITNPPFISLDRQPEETREKIASVMGELGTGRVDAYLAFLKIASEIVRPGGYGLFVLPHTFLRQGAARGMRELLARDFWVRCLVDLSDIPVFSELGSYVILLLFQKKPISRGASDREPAATIIVCRDFVGHALQDYLAGTRNIEGAFYNIFQVGQKSFTKSEWTFAPPSEASILNKLSSFSSLDRFVAVRQGLVTGADSVFIVKRQNVPGGEDLIWRPLLKDRDMLRYRVPKSSGWKVFYPYVGRDKIGVDQLRSDFPGTWAYLQEHRKELTRRRSATDNNWWIPTRSRDPDELFRPKIVTPHLILLPKFGLDTKGEYSVSHAPYMYPAGEGPEDELLKFFLAIMNSAVGSWLVFNASDKYSRGYARLEVKTLRSIAVPDPSQVERNLLLELLGLVDEKLIGNKDPEVDKAINAIVATIYGLDREEQRIVGIGGRLAEN